MDKFDRILQLHTLLSARRTAIPLEDLMGAETLTGGVTRLGIGRPGGQQQAPS